jgi:hypothetical protein
MLGSEGLEQSIQFLNTQAPSLIRALALRDARLKDDMDKENFWTAGNFEIRNVTCTGIVKEGVSLDLECAVKGKTQRRSLVAKFPFPVGDETALKRALIKMAFDAGRLKDTATLGTGLTFGDDFRMPLDFRFNDVPHAAWVRAYVYDLAASAIAQAVGDATIPDKSRLQVQVNVPEVNPAYDTYRIGTMLEMVRRMALTLAYQDKNVRICVQQPLGEGIFVGLPLALASMRFVLEKMDWGTRLDAGAGQVLEPVCAYTEAAVNDE